ncbi:uncharacterized protein ARMOST_15067 [Armillaria ostoyae]|uniref:Uncharacterized protein n=1 Tax=Armillaria ostoyae TaxID=47428 RepID=A0A284RSC1_ARMOS|nr:uncharacterized protein ARMOST_15067 [Armillaria ostoyae]
MSSWRALRRLTMMEDAEMPSRGPDWQASSCRASLINGRPSVRPRLRCGTYGSTKKADVRGRTKSRKELYDSGCVRQSGFLTRMVLAYRPPSCLFAVSILSTVSHPRQPMTLADLGALCCGQANEVLIARADRFRVA